MAAGENMEFGATVLVPFLLDAVTVLLVVLWWVLGARSKSRTRFVVLSERSRPCREPMGFGGHHDTEGFHEWLFAVEEAIRTLQPDRGPGGVCSIFPGGKCSEVADFELGIRWPPSYASDQLAGPSNTWCRSTMSLSHDPLVTDSLSRSIILVGPASITGRRIGAARHLGSVSPGRKMLPFPRNTAVLRQGFEWRTQWWNDGVEIECLIWQHTAEVFPFH